MLQFKMTGMNGGYDFSRIYYKDTLIDRDQMRGSIDNKILDRIYQYGGCGIRLTFSHGSVMMQSIGVCLSFDGISFDEPTQCAARIPAGKKFRLGIYRLGFAEIEFDIEVNKI